MSAIDAQHAVSDGYLRIAPQQFPGASSYPPPPNHPSVEMAIPLMKRNPLPVIEMEVEEDAPLTVEDDVGCEVGEPGQFDGSITYLRNRGQGAVKIALEIIAEGVKLQPNG